MKSRLLGAALAALVSGCASVQPAQMQLPAGLEARASRSAIDGLGIGTRGSFRVAQAAGQFTRAASRLSFFDVVATERGASGFSLSGGGFDAPVNARCGFKQRTVTIEVVQFRPKPFAYECEFDGAVAGRLTLHEAHRGEQTLTTERSGQITVQGTPIVLRSVHRVQGSPLPLAHAIGYVMERDGAAIGAVELNGPTPRLWLPNDAGGGARHGVLLAALALALLWDPASSAP
jgi:hypothetical protein